ncbi:MAG: response regulator [bacterium]|nr:response regulator [bacterium]
MKKKILIIEDDDAIGQALAMSLEFEDYEARLVLKAKTSLKIISTFKPNLILLDLLLSGTDGRDVAQRIKADNNSKKIPIILMSAHPTADKVAQELGVEGFIAKPFDTDDLLKKIKTILHSK